MEGAEPTPETFDADIVRRATPEMPELVELAKNVEASIFIEKEYVKTAEELGREYEPYDEASTFFVVESDGDTIGSTRIIANNENGFKTMNDAKSGGLDVSPEWQDFFEKVDPETVAEVGTIAVDKKYRGSHETRAAVKLYGAILAYCRQNDVKTLIASMDYDYYVNFLSIFGEAVRPAGEPKMYMGSDTVVLVMDPYAMLENSKQVSEALYAEIETASQNVV